MPLFRSSRVAVCALAAVGSLTVLLSPAQAAVASGEAKAGSGGIGCGASVSCKVFQQTCQITPANDLDASVRPAAVGGQWHAITWSAIPTGPTPAQGYLNVIPLNAQCQPIVPQILVPNSGAQVLFPGGTAYISASPGDRFVQFSFTLH